MNLDTHLRIIIGDMIIQLAQQRAEIDLLKENQTPTPTISNTGQTPSLPLNPT
jgi:hypothetical protein